MALPSFLGHFTLGITRVQRTNLDNSGLHYTIAPGDPDNYNVFGPLRPILCLALSGFDLNKPRRALLCPP